MCKRLLFFCLFSFCLAGTALADSVTYSISVNTSSLVRTSGSLDFQFNPGVVSQLANVQILGFATDGVLGTSTITGDVTGMLPGNVQFDNTAAFNDYFSGFTYGNTLAFDVSLFGPALTSPDGTSPSGSAFAFSMFSDVAGTVPALTTDETNGFAVTIDVNLDGTTTLNNFSLQTTTGNPVTPTPESGPLLLFVVGSGGLALLSLTDRKWRILRN